MEDDVPGGVLHLHLPPWLALYPRRSRWETQVRLGASHCCALHQYLIHIIPFKIGFFFSVIAGVSTLVITLDFLNSKVVITIDSPSASLDQVIFPAVTFCNINQGNT